MKRYKSCIFIMADGARADVFEELLRKGDMPNISRFIIEKGTYTNAVSVFPSTTGPAYTPFILGKYPGRCNLPGIRWFDRELYGTKLFSLHRFRSYVGIETFLMNGDISKDTKTLFEIFPNAISILNELNRGIGFSRDKTRFRKIYYKIKSHFTKHSDEVDLAARRILLDSLDNQAQFIYVVFLGIDTYSHSSHPFHKDVIDSYLRMDETIGLLCRALELKGRLDETLLIIASDHGLSPTHSHFDSVEFMNQLGFKTLHYPKVYKFFSDADAAIMISGNSMTHIYVKSPRGWQNRSTFEELTEVVDQLIGSNGVDIVAGIDEKGMVRIKSQQGEAAAWMDHDGCIEYKRIRNDPFGYNGLPSKMSHDEVLEYTFDSTYPDAIVQILQLLESPRSGDIVVSASPGYDLRARYEKPEHCSSHGSLIREHMLVPTAINTSIKRRFLRTVDFYPTILSLLGYDIPNDIDGVSIVN